MGSSPKSSIHGDWRVVYREQEENGERMADDRKTLADTLSLPKSICILSDSKTNIPTVTELDPPKLRLPQLGSDTIERVFPVRSVLSFDSTPSSALQTPSLDKLESPISPFSEESRTSLLLDDKLRNELPEPIQEPEQRTQGPKRPDYLSQLRKQKHELGESSTSNLNLPVRNACRSSKETRGSDTDKGNGDSAGNAQLEDNTKSKLKKSIDECGNILRTRRISRGIQMPRDDAAADGNSIRRFGALLVVLELEGNLTVQIASDNTRDIIGYSPDELFGFPSLCDILAPPYHQAFVSHAENVLQDEYDVEVSGPEIFALLIKAPRNHGKLLWCTMHISKVYKDYIICELEAERSGCPNLESSETEEANSVHRPYEPSWVEDPWLESNFPGHGLNGNSSTANANVPCLDLDAVNKLVPIIHRISSSQTIDILIDHAVSGLESLLQIHRVAVYHFDGDRNGIVVADSNHTPLDGDSFTGTRFNEDTFPAKIKSQYLRNTVCCSYRSHGDEAQLAYRSSINKLGIDTSHCYLTVAPKGVPQKDPLSLPCTHACMSIGISTFGKLWGLFCCQSYDENFRFHPLLQRAAWIISDSISSNMERLSYTFPFQPRYTKEFQPNLHSSAKGESSNDLLTIFGADYAAASILGETKILGKPPDSQEVLALLEYLRAKDLDTVLWSTDILSDFDDLQYSPGFCHLAGLLYIPLSPDGHDFIIFFQSEEERFSGESKQPNKRQAEWSATEFGKASILAMMYRTFTGIWQKNEAAMQDNQLLKLLLANSAHEFRTPLNAIINYLEIALDGNLNQETRESLSRSHSASKSLVYIINDLLDLTNAENGQNLIKDEVFSLSETLCEATDIFWEEARQKQVDLQVVQHSALPLVLGDQRRVRQVITNLISNAVQHTSVGAVTIESCVLSEPCDPDQIVIEVAIHDTGSGMPQETVETLFCQLEQVSNKGDMRNNTACGKESGVVSMEKDSVLGLGLALVARIVRNMNGQLSLKSEEGSGSCFKIRLKFPLPEGEDSSQTENRNLDDTGKDLLSCEKNQLSQDEKTTTRKDIPSYRCGDDASNLEDLGQQNGALVDVDVALKNGQSRSIAVSSSEQSTIESTTGPDPIPGNDSKTGSLNILVAEDDPINSTILRKRLEKFGHSVSMTGNGKECASVFQERPQAFDAVLMDLQMPIVDGSSSAKKIREHELDLKPSALVHDRIPIFAVSASLVERDRQFYIDSGFDGWIMKPIDFQRVHVLLGGVTSSQARNDCVYQAGMWEQGGWFETFESASRKAEPSQG